MRDVEKLRERTLGVSIRKETLREYESLLLQADAKLTAYEEREARLEARIAQARQALVSFEETVTAQVELVRMLLESVDKEAALSHAGRLLTDQVTEELKRLKSLLG